MTFFYNLNKTLDAIREKPELKHGQLNERDMSRVAKGYEKYGKEGMEALAKAGREGKDLDKVRAKYNKYDESVEEGLGDMARKVGGAVKSAAKKGLETLGHGDDAEMMRDLQRKMGVPQTGMKPGDEPNPKVVKEKMSPAKAKSFAALAEPKDKITFADKIAGAKKEVDEMLGDVAAEAMKNALTPKQKKLDKNNNGKLDANDFAMLRKGAGKEEEMEATGDYSAKKARAGKDIGKPGKGFAKIAKGAAERYGSKAAGERVAGAVLNKLRHKGANEGEMDEGFPTVAGARAEMNKRKVGDVTHGAKHDVEEIPGGRRVTRRVDDKGYSVGSDTDDEGNAKSTEKRGRGRPKKADKAPERVTAKATKHKGGRKTNEGADEGSDLVKLSKVIASCTTKEQLEAARKMAQNFLSKHASGELGFAGGKLRQDIGRRNDVVATIKQKNKEIGGNTELEEKAVSKKQQKFMGMVHATQKGEKAPSKEVAKVAKTMKKKDAEDFASTKHKGLPEKAPKKKEKTEEAGGTDTPTASSGFSFGKGIYDSMNRDLENMIKESMSRLDESMSINVSSSTEGGKNITVTASEEDAVKLADILKNAGLGGGEGYGGSGYQSSCGCGEPDCGCGDEQVDENQPDWPTNTETLDADPNLRTYSGGLNGPKSTGQTTEPIIAGQDERMHTYAEAEEDAIKRMMEMAGIKEDDVEEGNKFTGNLAKARADGKKEADLDGDGDMEKVRESVDQGILDATANLWSEYKGKYGV